MDRRENLRSREELWEIGLDWNETIQIRRGDDGMKYVAMSMWSLYKEKKGEAGEFLHGND